MTLAPVTPNAHDPVYGSPVADHEDLIKRARAASEKERRAHETWEAALEARDETVRALYVAARDDMSQNELARRIDLNPSTFRAITAQERKEARKKR